jgi:transketolase N-terminal domain/subunit
MVVRLLLYLRYVLFQVGPNEVYIVGRDDEESFDGESDEGASWETVDDTEMDTLTNSMEVNTT